MGEYFKECLDALSFMYNPSVDQSTRAQANEFLSDFLHKPSALEVANQILSTNNLPSSFYFYAANAMLFRLRMAFDDLPTIDKQNGFRQALFEHLERFNMNPTSVSQDLSNGRHLNVSERLCSAVAALMIQMMASTAWPTAISDVVNIFTAGAVGGDNPQQAQEINEFILVNILAALPDILYDDRLVIPPSSDIDLVENDCKSKEAFIYQLCRQYLTSGSSNPSLHLKIFDLLSSWSNRNFLSIENISRHDIYNYILSALEMPKFTVKACQTLSGLVISNSATFSSLTGHAEKPTWFVEWLDNTLSALTIYRYIYTCEDQTIPMALMNVLVDINEALLDCLIFDPHPTPSVIRQEFLRKCQACQQLSAAGGVQPPPLSTVISSYITPFPQSQNDVAFRCLHLLASFMMITTDPRYAYAVLTGQADITEPHAYPLLDGNTNSNPELVCITPQHIPHKYHAFDLQLPIKQTTPRQATTQFRGILTPSLRFWYSLDEACAKYVQEIRIHIDHTFQQLEHHHSRSDLSGVASDEDYQRELNSLQSQLDTFYDKRLLYGPPFLIVLRSICLGYQAPMDYDVLDTELGEDLTQFRHEFQGCIDEILTFIPSTTAFQFICSELREVVQSFSSLPQYVEYTQKLQQGNTALSSREIIYPLSFNGWQPIEAYLGTIIDVTPRLVNAVLYQCGIQRDNERLLVGRLFQTVDLPSLYYKEQEVQRMAEAYVPKYIELLQVLKNIGELLSISTSFYKNQVLCTTIYSLIDRFCVFLTFPCPILAVANDFHPNALLQFQQQSIIPSITTQCKSNAEILYDLFQFVYPRLHAITSQSPPHLLNDDVKQQLSRRKTPLFVEDAARCFLQIAMKCSRTIESTPDLKQMILSLMDSYASSFHATTHDMLALSIYYVIYSTPASNIGDFQQHFTRLLVNIRNGITSQLDQVGVLEQQHQQQALTPQQYKEHREPLDQGILQHLFSVDRIITSSQRPEEDEVETQARLIIFQFISSTAELFQQVIHRYITYIPEDPRVDKVCLIWTNTLSRCRHVAASIITPLCSIVCQYFATVKHSGLVYMADNIVRVVIGFQKAQQEYLARHQTNQLPDGEQPINAHGIIRDLCAFFFPTLISFCNSYANTPQSFQHLIVGVNPTPSDGGSEGYAGLGRTLGIPITVQTPDIQVQQHGIIHAAIHHDSPLVQNILIEPFLSQTVQLSAAGEAYPELTEDLIGFICATNVQSPDTIYQSESLPAILQVLTSMLSVSSPRLYSLSCDCIAMFIDLFITDGTIDDAHIVYEHYHEQQLTESEQWNILLMEHQHRVETYLLLLKILPTLYCYALFSIVSFRPVRCILSSTRLLARLSVLYTQTLKRHQGAQAHLFAIPPRFQSVLNFIGTMPSLEDLVAMTMCHSIFSKIHMNLRRDTIQALKDLAYPTPRSMRRGEDILTEVVRFVKGESKQSKLD